MTKAAETIGSGDIVRCNMSEYALQQLKRDYINFERRHPENFENQFLCRILIHYLNYARINFKKKIEAEMTEILKESKRNGKGKQIMRLTVTKPLVSEIEKFNFINDSHFKKSAVITYIFEHYAELDLSTREKIFVYPTYKMIADSIDEMNGNNKVLLITTSGKEYEVRPYRLVKDDNTFFHYLIGFSRPNGSEENFKRYSFRLSRIQSCTTTDKKHQLTEAEKTDVREALLKFGAAYIASSDACCESVVWLTVNAYNEKYLKVIAHQRPISTESPKTVIDQKTGERYFELKFNCSYWQLRNYFFSYGAEVIIISPKEYREKFIIDYTEALDRYKKANNL